MVSIKSVENSHLVQLRFADDNNKPMYLVQSEIKVDPMPTEKIHKLLTVDRNHNLKLIS